MDRGVKVVIASCILAGGIGAAMLFRRPSPRARPANLGSPDSLILRDEHDAPGGVLPPLGRLTAEIEASGQPAPAVERSSASRPGAALADRGQPAPPPPLARDYPHLRERAAPAWDPSTPSGDPSSGGSKRRHKIIDGDTLALLAERYLGDPDRYPEIYEANREVLPSPEVLPIGAELRIPPTVSHHSPRNSVAPEGPLVPVVPDYPP